MTGNNAVKILIVALVFAGVVAVASLKSSCCGTTQAAPPGGQTQTDQAYVGQARETGVPPTTKPPRVGGESGGAFSRDSAVPAVGVPRLLDLGSGTCIPCKMMMPVLDDMRDQYRGKLQVDFINITENPKAADQYGIDVIPTQILFDATGKERGRHVGYWPKEEIIAQFAVYGVKLEAGEAGGPGQ